MKNLLPIQLLLAGIVMVILFNSCSKSYDKTQQQAIKKEYRLYNQSSGTPLDAGSFTISLLADSNAMLTINLAAGYRVANNNLPANISTTDSIGNELVYATLSQVDGNTGVGNTSPVNTASNNFPIKYIALITKIGFVVKVMNGTNVQARGVIN